jgi:hypothetical protein
MTGGLQAVSSVPQRRRGASLNGARIGVAASVGCLMSAATLVGCRDLPRDFATLPLEKKIEVYEAYVAEVGKPNLTARAWIAWHGVPAADLMAGYVSGATKGIPRREALHVIWSAQLRGCSLAGTAAEKAVAEVVGGSVSGVWPHEVELAKQVLSSIRANRHVEKLDRLPPGPCNGAQR